MESIRVVIFGTEYSIKGDVNVETTRQIARYVNSKMAEIYENTSSRDNVKIAVLSALNIGGELFELKGRLENGAKEQDSLRSRALSIGKKIDDALERS
jgi:cell division protein ZapA